MTNYSQTLLSVIIPTLNEAEHLPVLLRDLAAQRHLSLEIIIGDGGSTDATGTAAAVYGAHFVEARRGRAAQMNAASRQATGDYLLFLHADTSIDNPDLLYNALHAITSRQPGHSRVAGHFPLRFVRASDRNAVAYRYAEEKTAFNRVNTTNGDQGILLSADFFRYLGGFDERLPFLEDQRMAEKIRAEGTWITLPGHLNTSARRFEAEGFHPRYILMSMMMGLHSIGAEEFFARAPGVYKSQQYIGRLRLSPFFDLIWCLMRDEWGPSNTIRTFYRLGRYIRQNSWQMFFFCDVLLRPLLGSGRYPFLTFHDRLFGPCTNFKLFDAVTGVLCFVWFMGVMGPFFRLVEGRQQNE